MKSLLVQQSTLPAVFSEPDATPQNHYCTGRHCTICRRRNYPVSHPDRDRTPNHYCPGRGCPKCNSNPGGRALSTSDLPISSCAFHSITFDDDESPPFSGPAHCWDPMAPSMHSEPEPPHRCRVIPCKVCGRRFF